MSIENATARPMTLARAAAIYYPEGTAACTLARHIRQGVRVGGKIVKLEASRLGGRWVTTAEAVERFRDACTAEGGGEPVPSASVAHAKADAYLKSMGL